MLLSFENWLFLFVVFVLLFFVDATNAKFLFVIFREDIACHIVYSVFNKNFALSIFYFSFWHYYWPCPSIKVVIVLFKVPNERKVLLLMYIILNNLKDYWEMLRRCFKDYSYRWLATCLFVCLCVSCTMFPLYFLCCGSPFSHKDHGIHDYNYNEETLSCLKLIRFVL